VSKAPVLRLDRLLSNLGYGTRREVQQLIWAGLVTLDGEVIDDSDQKIFVKGDLAARMIVDGEPLDPPPGLALMLNKPLGVTCSHKELGPLVYALLPERWRRREPAISTVGRLDKDTSGLLLMTDDGALIHRLTSPKKHVPKVYEIGTIDAVTPKQIDELLHGVILHDDPLPVRAAAAEQTGERALRMTLLEGKYHQVKRMVAATGNTVNALHRSSYGVLALPPDLAPGQWRWLAGPGDVLGAAG
jgi:16S rRNA pseudouridine516 synthase